MKNITITLCTAVLLLFVKSCATVGSPTGGDKDTTSPVVKNMIPANHSTHFKGNQITIEYNEYLELNTLDKELVIVPRVEKYEIEKGTKSFKVKFKQALEPNTTYQIFFGKGVKDVTEGNQSKLKSFVFSTGPFVDSLQVTGTIINIHNNKPAVAFVGLYTPSDTLEINKHLPYYWTTSDESGNFKLGNLKAGTYALYAFTDVNNNRIYDKKELLAYSENNLKTSDKPSVALKLSSQNLDTLKLISATDNKENYQVKYTKGLYSVQMPNNQVFKVEKDRIYIFKGTEDSLHTSIIVKDSMGNQLNSDIHVPNKSKVNKNVKFVKESINMALPGSKYIYLSDRKITKINHDSISIVFDGQKLAKEGIKQSKDSIYFIVPAFKDSLSVVLKKSAFISVFNDSSASMSAFHKKMDESNYGIIAGTVVYEGNIVLELLKNDKVAFSTRSKTFEAKYLNPGEYMIRIIKDTDNNGYWTQGNYKTKKQPEEIFYNSKTLNLKANWELRDLLIKVQ
ncbi:MAG TPA: Ig-like domain-containing domain [Cytophagales bacterium]|nr:Ig-like domain-containing domain [Cytophagales bacterium]